MTIDLIGITGDQGDCGTAAVIQNPDLIRLDNVRFRDRVGEDFALCPDLELIADLQLIEVAENLTVDVIMRRQHEIAGWVAGVNPIGKLPDSQLERFHVHPLHNGLIEIECGDSNADGGFAGGLWATDDGLYPLALHNGLQVLGHFVVVELRADVTAGKHVVFEAERRRWGDGWEFLPDAVPRQAPARKPSHAPDCEWHRTG